MKAFVAPHNPDDLERELAVHHAASRRVADIRGHTVIARRSADWALRTKSLIASSSALRTSLAFPGPERETDNG